MTQEKMTQGRGALPPHTLPAPPPTYVCLQNNGLRGTVNVAECVVEDLDEKGNLRTGPMQANLAVQDKNQLVIRIRHKVRGGGPRV